MSDIALITSIAANAVAALKNARELATTTGNSELREQLRLASDDLLTLREKLLDVVEENRSLRTQLEERRKVVGPVAPFGYFYMADDSNHEHPLCSKCYQDGDKLGFMTPQEEHNYGLRRKCRNCGHTVWEREMDLGRASRESSSRSRSSYGPWS